MRNRHRRSLAEEIMAQEDPAVRRWKTSLHEAGHAVAGRLLLKRTVKAAVYEAGVGAAYLNIGSVPQTFEEALAVAAGPAAEALAEEYPAPEATPPPALRATHPESTAPLIAQLRQSPSDAVSIAQWCIGGIEKQPNRWTSRFYWLHREADFFVARHQQKIVEVAVDMLQRGIATLAGAPVTNEPGRRSDVGVTPEACQPT